MSVPLDEIKALRNEVEHLRVELTTIRSRSRRNRRIGVALIALLGLVPAWGIAGAKKRLVIQDKSTGQAVEIAADGIRFTKDGASKMHIQVGEDWADMTMWGASGNATWNVHTDAEGTASKIFSQEEHLRVEVSDNLLDSGSGVRLYDKEGRPRATFYAGKWGGKSGLSVTNDIRQPRLDLYAVDRAESVVLVNDDSATTSAELAVHPNAEAMYRYTGMVPLGDEGSGPLVPLVYLSNEREEHVFLSTMGDD